MRKASTAAIVLGVGIFLGLLLIHGCGGKPLSSLERGKYLVVGFEEGYPLRYKMTSSRSTALDLTGSSGKQQPKPQEMVERLEMVMAYKPVEVDPFGLTRIEAVCESASVLRSGMTGRKESSDAIENLKGRAFILDLSPKGQIADFTELEKLLKEIGDTAFDSSRQSRVKNPDMLSDFIAMQWYLWDSIASVPNPLDGVVAGQQWQSKQLVPWPIPIPNTPCRITTFTLESIEPVDGMTKAVIASEYALSDKTLENFPKPYDGSFQMRGLFGFLRDYQFKSLVGKGQQRFNMTTGQIESDHQDYTVTATASFLLPLGDSVPNIVIHQTIDIELLTAGSSQEKSNAAKQSVGAVAN